MDDRRLPLSVRTAAAAALAPYAHPTMVPDGVDPRPGAISYVADAGINGRKIAVYLALYFGLLTAGLIWWCSK